MDFFSSEDGIFLFVFRLLGMICNERIKTWNFLFPFSPCVFSQAQSMQISASKGISIFGPKRTYFNEKKEEERKYQCDLHLNRFLITFRDKTCGSNLCYAMIHCYSSSKPIAIKTVLWWILSVPLWDVAIFVWIPEAGAVTLAWGWNFTVVLLVSYIFSRYNLTESTVWFF